MKFYHLWKKFQILPKTFLKNCLWVFAVQALKWQFLPYTGTKIPLLELSLWWEMCCRQVQCLQYVGSCYCSYTLNCFPVSCPWLPCEKATETSERRWTKEERNWWRTDSSSRFVKVSHLWFNYFFIVPVSGNPWTSISIKQRQILIQ